MGKTLKLYYHKTDGGAEYLMNTFIKSPNGEKEGIINNKNKGGDLNGKD